MNRYVTMVNFTSKGIDAIRQSPDRADALRESAKQIGCKITSALWTMGPHDAVITFEAPSDEAASALILGATQHGFVTSCTMRACSNSSSGFLGPSA